MPPRAFTIGHSTHEFTPSRRCSTVTASPLSRTSAAIPARAGIRSSPPTRWPPLIPRAEFAAGLAELEALARERPTAVMCAEGLWWRGHRRLVADVLTVRGWTVCHIAPGGALSEHALPDFAVVEGTRITYPAPQLRLD